jgi:hypothetical protein
MDRKILWSYRKRRSTKKQTFIEKPITQTIKGLTKTLTYKYRWSLLPQNTVNENERARVLDLMY